MARLEITRVTGHRQAEAIAIAESLVADKAASRLARQDSTLWGPDAEAEACVRLAWTTLPLSSRPLVAQILELRKELHSEGLDRIVLAGMGGSSLAPEVICAAHGVPLTVLDTTDPGQVADALAGDLRRTVLVVSSKSGSTVETDSHRRIFEKAFTDEGIDAASRIVVVTDPGSPLAEASAKAGYRKVFEADPHVGGRYSALTAFGLVPSGLAGADIDRLLTEAADTTEALATDTLNNPAIVFAAELGAAHTEGGEKIVFTTKGQSIGAFGDWVEQLIAESTGKNGTGMLPVVMEPHWQSGTDGKDGTGIHVITSGEELPLEEINSYLSSQGPLGAQFQLWETTTALLGKVLGINPFDQPDVEAAKKAARALLDNPPAESDAHTPLLTEGAVQVFAEGGWIGTAPSTLSEALKTLVDAIPEFGYLSVQAYLDRIEDASAALLRPELARRVPQHVTYGWGPRFLHSTGQYHKGGHQNGAFLQLTGASEEDIQVPDRPYTLSTLQLAQAGGDAQVLAEHKRPVLRLHLTDRMQGLIQLVEAVQSLPEYTIIHSYPV
ncbi:glucose-6-phosphate isomerase [Pseudonocardiaceae bacterium YIM PH 21723]|nr:glucose-6-phosphate isomerase [Pseudonocardiaceae bacterium YIM PH 21723]